MAKVARIAEGDDGETVGGTGPDALPSLRRPRFGREERLRRGERRPGLAGAAARGTSKLLRLSDEHLLARYRAGHMDSFEILLARYEGRIYNFIFRLVNNRATAEELTQEVFLRVVRAADGFKHEAKFGTWVFTIAHNLCVDFSRRARHRRTTLSLPDLSNAMDHRGVARAVAPGPAVDDQAYGAQVREALAVALQSLPDDLREVFLLREAAGITFREIAKIVGCSENTVKSRMRYALHHLRGRLIEAGIR